MLFFLFSYSARYLFPPVISFFPLTASSPRITMSFLHVSVSPTSNASLRLSLWPVPLPSSFSTAVLWISNSWLVLSNFAFIISPPLSGAAFLCTSSKPSIPSVLFHSCSQSPLSALSIHRFSEAKSGQRSTNGICCCFSLLSSNLKVAAFSVFWQCWRHEFF